MNFGLLVGSYRY